MPTNAFLEKSCCENVLWCIVKPVALLFIMIMYQPYPPPHHHLPRPPTLPPKPQRMRKSRPRSIFNRKLFNGNMEAFIQVLAHLCSLSLHELSCLTSSPWGVLLPFAHFFFTQTLAHSCTDFPSCSLPCLYSLAIQERQGEGEKAQSNMLWRWFDFISSTLVQGVIFNVSFFCEPPQPSGAELIWLCECQLAANQPCSTMQINTWPHPPL